MCNNWHSPTTTQMANRIIFMLIMCFFSERALLSRHRDAQLALSRSMSVVHVVVNGQHLALGKENVWDRLATFLRHSGFTGTQTSCGQVGAHSRKHVIRHVNISSPFLWVLHRFDREISDLCILGLFARNFQKPFWLSGFSKSDGVGIVNVAAISAPETVQEIGECFPIFTVN